MYITSTTTTNISHPATYASAIYRSKATQLSWSEAMRAGWCVYRALIAGTFSYDHGNMSVVECDYLAQVVVDVTTAKIEKVVRQSFHAGRDAAAAAKSAQEATYGRVEMWTPEATAALAGVLAANWSGNRGD